MNQEIQAIVVELRAKILAIPPEERVESDQLFRCAAMLDAMEWGPKYGKFPDQKYHRWIGFIQGVLSCYEYLDVNGERERVRKIVVKESGIFSFDSDLVYILQPAGQPLVAQKTLPKAVLWFCRMYGIPESTPWKDFRVEYNELRTGGTLYLGDRLLGELRYDTAFEKIGAEWVEDFAFYNVCEGTAFHGITVGDLCELTGKTPADYGVKYDTETDIDEF